jgi:predicted membrane channel-forming protein YqfA (hemolysin III family)
MAAHEDRGERLDRELIELLNGLRVVLPGVQVLFAFLLTVPFTQAFGEADSLDRSVYFAAFVCTTAASILLIAPSAYHRLRWRQHDKERLLRTANAFAIAGLGMLAAAITCTVFLVTDVLYSLEVAGAVTAVVGVALLWCWYALPLWRRLRDDRSEVSPLVPDGTRSPTPGS